MFLARPMILSTSAFEVCDGKNFGPRPGPMTAVKCSNIRAAWLRAALQGLVQVDGTLNLSIRSFRRVSLIMESREVIPKPRKRSLLISDELC
jgi:hypothetical protein